VLGTFVVWKWETKGWSVAYDRGSQFEVEEAQAMAGDTQKASDQRETGPA
jgi:hypothetical protein